MASATGEKSWETFCVISVADLLSAKRAFGSTENVEADFVSMGATALVETCCVNVNPSAELLTAELTFGLVVNEEGNLGSFAWPDNLATEDASGEKSFAELVLVSVSNEEGIFGNCVLSAMLATEDDSSLKSFEELSSFSLANTDVNFVSVGSADLNWLSRAGEARAGAL